MAFALTTFACDDDDGTGTPVGGTGGTGGSFVAPPAQDTALVRFLHLGGNQGEVRIFVNASTDPLIRNLSFEEGSKYISLPVEGVSYRFRIAPAATPATTLLETDTTELVAGSAYTVVIYEAGTGDDANSPVLLQTVDATAAASPNTAEIRALHLAEGLGTIDVLEGSNGAITFDNVANAADRTPGSSLSLSAPIPTTAVWGIDVDANTTTGKTAEFACPNPLGLLPNQSANLFFYFAEDNTTLRVLAQPSTVSSDNQENVASFGAASLLATANRSTDCTR